MDHIHVADNIEQANFWIGFFMNLLLAYLIMRSRKTDLGAYKYLQLTFVVNDITFATYCNIMKDKMITKDYSFAMFLTRSIGNNLHLVCTYGSLYSLVLVIVAFNFLYRYWAVVNPSLIDLFSKSWFLCILILVASLEFAVWYAACYFLFKPTEGARADLIPEFATKYGLDAMTHAIVLGNYFRDGRYNLQPIAGLAIFFGIICACVVFMVLCTTAILRRLSQAKAISEKTKKLQYALFRSLAVQTIIPLIFLHINGGSVLFLPLFGLDLSWYCDWISVSCSCFPPFDAVATILLMRDYRETVVDLVFCRKFKTIIHPTSTSTALNNVNSAHEMLRE